MYKPTDMVWPFSAASLFKITLLASAVAALGLTGGCTSSPNTAKTQSSKQLSSGLLDASSLDSLEDLLSATDMRAVEGDRLLILKHGDVWKRMTVGFKMDLNHWDSRIEAQRGWFISRQPYLDRLSARASRYLYHTVKEAERRGLPTELALLPVIESSYDPAATSSAAAAGLWQFIPSTGRIYGLKQTSQYDGRRDVVESTRAAYEFLGSLYNQFGSWELALAAYNAGPGRIQQAINRNRAAGLPTDYWSLKLPQETMNYVPRFLAVAQIIKNPKAYGVNLPPIANRPHFREIMLGGPVDLNQISSITGLSRAELYALNPGYRGERIDPESPMRIIIPTDINPAADAKLKALNTGGLWASNNTAAPQAAVSINTTTRTPGQPAARPNVTTSARTPVTTVTTRPANTAPASNTTVSSAPRTTASQATATTTSVTTPQTLRTTPRGSNALAAFAAGADVPSAPRIPVAITPANNVKPVRVEPPITAKEREQIVAMIRNEGLKETPDQALEPKATPAETQRVIEELTALAPQGTEIVDPLDGKIKLTAIQTSQSVAEQEGKEVTKGFAYPKALAESAVAGNTPEAKLNSNKPFIRTDSDIVVVQPSGQRSTYTVQPGDTLAIIATKNGVSWRDIAKWNQIDPTGTLFVGTSLYLYDAKPQQIEKPVAVEAAKPESYTVKANDSLTAVADQFGLSVKQLADYNNLSTTSGLMVGQRLSLKPSKTSNASHVTNAPTKSYTVKRGEYLKLIADRYALSNQELANLTPGLSTSSSLMVGQKINVPAAGEVSTNTSSDNKKVVELKTESYKVQRGDTLSSIASRAKMTLPELAALNNLSTNNSIRVGQNLKIPANALAPTEYTVQSGDSLNSVAAKFGLELAELADSNGLNRNAGLRVGQRLSLVPTAATASSSSASTRVEQTPDFHTVKSGETLSSIASQYYLQLNYLLALNNLTRNSSLRAGQRLKLSGEVPETTTSTAAAQSSDRNNNAPASEAYTVKAGESLNSISARLGVTTKELADLNGLTTRSSLQRGQSLKVPKLITDYKVKRGDTLIGLAGRFGMSIADLASLNNIKQNAQLRIGDVIKVPNS